jgi:hypothetical protein
MCNAKNHAPNCRCGWGGEGHLGGNSGNYGYPINVPPLQFTAYETFVNPNARCPICTLPVFFYQSEYGGRVFFDALGPPWPKHPCTDNGREPLIFDPHTSNFALAFNWQKDGWEPILGCKIASVDPYTWRVTGVSAGAEIALFLDRELAENQIHASLELITAQCREIEPREYRVSLYTTLYDVIELTTYTGQYYARHRVVNAHHLSDPHGVRANNERNKILKCFLVDHLERRYWHCCIQDLIELKQKILDMKRNVNEPALLELAHTAEMRLQRFQDAMARDRLEELAAEIYVKCEAQPRERHERKNLGQDLTLLRACLPRDERRNTPLQYFDLLGLRPHF